MDNLNRAQKRRRTVRGRRGITEGDEIMADGIIGRTVTHETEDGPVREFRRRAVWLNQPEDNPPMIEDVPDVGPTDVGHEFGAGPGCSLENRVEAVFPTMTRTPRTQQYYLQEFVKRVDPMLTALLSREVPEKTTCPQCDDGNVARWRCRDCTTGDIVCRGCMRKLHAHSPLHRIEMWTGECFRGAELWQVGTYILVPHHSGERLCAALAWNRSLLDAFQIQRDASEQTALGHGWPTQSEHPTREDPRCGEDAHENGPHGTNEPTEKDDRVLDEELDAMYWQNRCPTSSTGLDIMEEDEEEMENDENDEVILMPPPDYMPSLGDLTNRPSEPSRADTERPRTDALENPFLRVVNTNGIHHIAVVSCHCRGRENTHCDLMAARLVPTSFVRYRTVFTHAVLDDFRLDNLECKASAYQYFQKLRRLTSVMAPDSVPNLYHELRRMSRVWRWMKKLKWAGSAYVPVGTAPVPGDLANFCPTCPQPGMNLPDNWKLDPNRYAQDCSGSPYTDSLG